MPTNTPNLNLIKPLVSEHYDVVVANANNNILDTEVANKAPKANPTFTGTQTLPNIVTNGIKFPATQVPSADPNTLDDYEEGTWTPELKGGTTDPSVTYGDRYGSYTKVGRLVTCHVMIIATITVGGSGGLSFTLPFIAKNSPLTYAHTRVGWVDSAKPIITTGLSPIHNENKSSLYSGTYANVNIDANGIGAIQFATMFSYFTD